MLKKYASLILLALILIASTANAAPWFNRVLVSNDDGINDPRLHVLAEAFAATGAEVIVVAPLVNCSGSSNYVSVYREKNLAVEPRDFGPGIEAWAVDGFPGDCVMLALLQIMADDPPDLVVGGINSGPNLADAWIASGTIGIARLAAHEGIPAIAFSGLSSRDSAKMASVPQWCAKLAMTDHVRDLADGAYLNVNFPMGLDQEIIGATWAETGSKIFHDAFDLTGQDEAGRDIWKLRYWIDDGDQSPDSDVAQHRAGYVTVTPLRVGDSHSLDQGVALPSWR